MEALCPRMEGWTSTDTCAMATLPHLELSCIFTKDVHSTAKVTDVVATIALQFAVELTNHPRRSQKMKRHSVPGTLVFRAAQSAPNTGCHVATFIRMRCRCSIGSVLPKGVATLLAKTQNAAWGLRSRRTDELTFATTVCRKEPRKASDALVLPVL